MDVAGRQLKGRDSVLKEGLRLKNCEGRFLSLCNVMYVLFSFEQRFDLVVRIPGNYFFLYGFVHAQVLGVFK